jgi:putative ABC transport system substrate-binding protein
MTIIIARRDFITLLGGAAAGWPISARAQQPLPVVGTLYGVSAAAWAGNMAEFRRGLAETGFEEGRNVAIESRWADDHFERMPAMAADLISRKVAVILVGAGPEGVRATMAATRTIPIVFTTATDPVAAGYVASMNRPGGNATGLTNMALELAGKRLNLLHEALPKAGRIALLLNRNDPVISQSDFQAMQSAARGLGLEIIVLNVSGDEDLEPAFANAVEQRAAALQVGSDATFNGLATHIAALALRHRLPTMGSRFQVGQTGVLMGYGPGNSDMYRQAGIYVGRILKGARPADLPIVQPTKFELAINLKTAKALGLTVPDSLLALADEVLE